MIYILIPILLWSLAPIVGYNLNNLNILTTLFYLFSTAFLFFMLYGIYNVKVRKIDYGLKNVDKSFFKYITLIVINVMIYQGSYYWGVANYNALEINTINYLWGVFVPLFSLFLISKNKESHWFDWILLILAFISITFVTNIYESFSNFNIGHLFMIFGAAATALNTVLALRIKEKYKTINVEITYVIFTFIVSILLLFSILYIDKSLLNVEIKDFFLIFVLGFVIFGITRPIWYFLLEKYNKVKMITFAYITPILGNLWLVIFTDNELHNSMIIGFLLMMVVLVLSNENIQKKIKLK